MPEIQNILINPVKVYLEAFKSSWIYFYGYYSKSGKMSFPSCLNKLEVLSVCHMDEKQKEKNLQKHTAYRILAARVPCYLFYVS